MPEVSANMGLRVWTDNDDTFESDQLASNFMKLDFHDHSPGRGLQIPTEGFKDASISSVKLSNAATLKAVGSFSAYRNAAVSPTTGSVIIFDTEEWDFSNWYDIGNGRFTPQVAGYYRLSARVGASANLTADQYYRLDFLKNGAEIKRGKAGHQRGTAVTANSVVQGLVLANGTTDFFETRITHDVGAGSAIQTGAALSYYQGELVGRS